MAAESDHTSTTSSCQGVMVAMSRAIGVGAAARRARAAARPSLSFPQALPEGQPTGFRQHPIRAVIQQKEAPGEGFLEIQQERLEHLIQQLPRILSTPSLGVVRGRICVRGHGSTLGLNPGSGRPPR
jgi:hypothetical protein